MIFLIICGVFWTGFRLRNTKPPARKRRWWHFVDIFVIWLLIIPFFGFMAFVLNPPHFWELHTQRQKVLSRLEAVGGWEKLRSDCLLLAQQNGKEGLEWRNGRIRWGSDTNYQLPPTITALKPMTISYIPSPAVREFGRHTNVDVVSIRLFGMHATGGHSTPYYGIEVVWGPGTNRYRPPPAEMVLGNQHLSYSVVAENIYEVY